MHLITTEGDANAQHPGTSPTADAPVEPTKTWKISRLQTVVVLCTPLIATVVAWGGAAGHYWGSSKKKSTAPPVATREVDAAKLYAMHCASCHGDNGNANGPTSPYIDPPARQFGEERFRLTSTSNGVPTDADLMFILRHGIPGSAMPNFEQLSDEERRALVERVRRLTYNGLYGRIARRARESGEIELDAVGEMVDRLNRTGDLIEIPVDFPPPNEESLARGRKLYVATCQSCHGPEGRGDGPQVKELKNENGRPTRPRDLTRGGYKGGGSREQLYTRILAGMPGTPMPASNTLKPLEVCDLVNYVRSLMPAVELK